MIQSSGKLLLELTLLLLALACKFDASEFAENSQPPSTTHPANTGNECRQERNKPNSTSFEQLKVNTESEYKNVKVKEDEEGWEYEPRIWSYDDPKSLANDKLIQKDEDDWSSNYELDYLPELSQTSIESRFKQDEADEQSQRDPHESHYFVGSTRAHHLQFNLEPKQSQEPRECNQFRVDIKEAIICDKKRCDKLDFEWPRYENQISIIQTTRDGMRFKQVDLAMSSSSIVKRPPGRGRTSSREFEPERSRAPQKVKIDILDFLKPKPTSSTTTTTTTSTTTTSTTTSATPTQSTQPSTTTSDKPTTPSGTTLEPDQFTATETAPSDETSPPTTPKPIKTTPASTAKPSNANDAGYNDEAEKEKLVTTLRLDTRRLKQKMIGFGGALSDSTCRNIKSLSAEMADSLMEDYFGSRGLRYNIARLSVGSSDFSTTPYTNNDRPDDVSPEMILRLRNRHLFTSGNYSSNGNRIATALPAADDDLQMKNFKLVSEDHDFKLPIVRQAMATATDRQLLLFASMWSPPIWMKNNSHIVHGYLKGDVYGPYYRSLAELMLRWLEAYRQQGIEFWAFTGLNEPVTGIQPFIFHNSLGITKRDYFTFLKLYLGPMLRQRNFANLKLLLLDDNKGFAPNYVKSAMSDPQLAQMIQGIAFHWYMNDEYENLDFISRDYPQKFLLSSEASNGYLPFQVHTLPGDWDRGVAYMLDIIASCKHSAAGWVDWNMALDLGGGPSWAKNNLDAAIIVNGHRDEYYKSPMFYAMGHFSRFVEPGSHRLDQILSHARFDLPLDAVSFLTPSNFVVIVALNENKAPIPIKIIVNRRLIRQLDLRPQSFSTIVFKAPAQPPLAAPV